MSLFRDNNLHFLRPSLLSIFALNIAEIVIVCGRWLIGLIDYRYVTDSTTTENFLRHFISFAQRNPDSEMTRQSVDVVTIYVKSYVGKLTGSSDFLRAYAAC